MKKTVCAVLLIAVATSACGSTSGGAALSSSRKAIAPQVSSATGGPAAGGEEVPQAPTDVAVASTPAPDPAQAALDSQTKPYIVEGKYPHVNPGESARVWGDYPIEIALTPVCATAGTVMRAVVKTGPDARVGGAVRYIDGKPHEDYTYGRAPTGEWVWTWTIKPDVPHGQADVFVTAGKPGEGGGSVITAFTVAASC